MWHWILLASALVAVALSALTAVRSPDWAPWRLAVLAGEFGHWLVVGPIGVAGLAWGLHGPNPVLTAVTIALCLVAVGLFLKPCVEARRVAQALPEQLAGAFGRADVARPAFSAGALFGRGLASGKIETRNFSNGLALDFYRPANGSRAAAPCVVAIHGGGWDNGDRTQLATLNHWIASRGYGVAAISYRLAPKFIWPAQRDDVLAAITFLKANAGELGIDAGRLVLLGRSAGGQIAEAVGCTADDRAIRGIVGLYAPTDMHFAYATAREDDVIRSPTLMRQFLGGPPETARAAYDSASAYQHVNAGTPPTLLVHGRIDTLVWHRHSERLATRLAEHGVPHAFVSLPWATHAFEANLRGPGGQLTTYALEWFLAAVTR